MSGGVSPGTGRRYPLTMVCAVFRVARSTVYATSAARPAVTLGKRGPKTVTSDAELVVAIRAVLAATPFHGEGYRKVRARLAHHGLAVGGKRVRRLMRQHQLLAPRRLGPPNGDPAHAAPSPRRGRTRCGAPRDEPLHGGGRLTLIPRRHRPSRR